MNSANVPLTNLNTEQKKAVLHTTGSLLIIAGAGSGKTRVITHRIIHLIEQAGVSAAQIVALTFTNKAAQEMKQRISAALPNAHILPFIGTFHGYCLYLLHNHKHLLPFETFSICDEDDKHAILAKLLKQSPLHTKRTAQQISHVISRIKSQTVDYQQAIHLVEDPLIKDLIIAYEKEKKASSCFDFDDLLLETLSILKHHPEVRSWHQETIRHILVDEYQDTNQIQHELLKLMVLSDDRTFSIDSLCAVGDEDQSIYSWRGATVDNIIHFRNDFKNTTLIKMEQNYRSKEPILAVANAIIQNNKKRNEKELWSSHKGKDCVRILNTLSGYQEADIIARYCALLHAHNKLNSAAILYRTHYQSRVLEEALLKQSVPYMIIGGIRFYERKEIKDMIAYLRLIVNPFDRVAFARVINCPARGLGDVFQDLFKSEWDKEPLMTIHQIGKKLLDTKLITGVKAKALERFLAIFNQISPTDNAPEVITTIIANSDYLTYLKDNYEKNEAQEKQENLQELTNAAYFFTTQGKASIEDFLREVSLLQEKTHDRADAARVTLMTIHAAKGLEFKYVVIAGLEENLFPSMRALATEEQLEEERRLLYVAITRAEEYLLITHARYRQTYGSMEPQISSRFIDEIPRTHARFDKTEHWQQYEVKTYFAQWLNLEPTQSAVMTFGATKRALPDPFEESQAEEIPTRYVRPKTNTGKRGPFKINQPVQHAKFGLGIVQAVEEKPGKSLVTAKFKDGVKTIEGSFLTSV